MGGKAGRLFGTTRPPHSSPCSQREPVRVRNVPPGCQDASGEFLRKAFWLPPIGRIPQGTGPNRVGQAGNPNAGATSPLPRHILLGPFGPILSNRPSEKTWDQASALAGSRLPLPREGCAHAKPCPAFRWRRLPMDGPERHHTPLELPYGQWEPNFQGLEAAVLASWEPGPSLPNARRHPRARDIVPNTKLPATLWPSMNSPINAILALAGNRSQFGSHWTSSATS